MLLWNRPQIIHYSSFPSPKDLLLKKNTSTAACTRQVAPPTHLPNLHLETNERTELEAVLANQKPGPRTQDTQQPGSVTGFCSLHWVNGKGNIFASLVYLKYKTSAVEEIVYKEGGPEFKAKTSHIPDKVLITWQLAPG